MDKLISQQAAIDALCKSECGWSNAECRHKDDTDFCVTCDNVKIIKSLPSVQPETAKRIVGKPRNGMTLWYQCDTCNEPVDAQDNYCRGCGRVFRIREVAQ